VPSTMTDADADADADANADADADVTSDVAADRPASLTETGARNWLYVARFAGDWLRRRTVVNWVLILVYLGLPWIKIGGHQAVLLDVPRRKFAFFGFVAWPQDTFLLWLLLVTFFCFVFFVTALWGRIWCGWACPQTVFMEGVFRYVERWIEGDRNRRRKRDEGPWTWEKVRVKALKHAAFLAISVHVANTAICYFVGTDRVFEMTLRSPSAHPSWFLFMAGTSLVFYFDFAWFREQLCIVACPYGRWQSVLLDEHSLIVGYDPNRGEKRGRVRERRQNPETSFGDCIDCLRCVDVCPTGIDIRHGLQMECVNCTACIDACDAVMDKRGTPRGLIRYTSLQELEKKPRRAVRGRTIGYGIAFLASSVALVVAVANREIVEVQILRGRSGVQRYEGIALNHLQARIVNKGDQPAAVRVEAPQGYTLEAPRNPWPVKPSSVTTMQFFVGREVGKIPRRGERILLRFYLGDRMIYEHDVRIRRR